ncbi:MAG: cobaltochelatase subunit CobN [Gammaproteobacteria bacterium]|nr:cobaltochelatase subunit CobN [Gammaproteobacteria bacterium]
MKNNNKYALFCLLIFISWTAPVFSQVKIGLLSTQFVLEQKFKLMEQAAHKEGVELAWTQVDREGEAGVKRVMQDAAMLIVDAPRSDDIAQIERIAADALKANSRPTLNINIMNPPERLKPVNLDPDVAQRFFEYYSAGTPVNHERMFQYINTVLTGGDVSKVAEPMKLPNGGIYHPEFANLVFDALPDYLAWWEKHSGKKWQENSVIAMEISSTYISDGQLRMLAETVQSIEKAGGVPLVFFRSRPPVRPADPAVMQGSGQSDKNGKGRPTAAQGRGKADVLDSSKGPDRGFPNPKPSKIEPVNEAILMMDGKLLPNVMMVNTFLGNNPDGRKAWHQAMGIPVINVINYRKGKRADYYQDLAGVTSFELPFTLTNAEYIGMQDPVVLSSNEDGEMVPIPEQMDLLIGKAMNLAKLQTMANADKKVALLFWNHPPGEKNQGASNMNVPRSIEYLIEKLKAEGYAFNSTSEAEIIEAVAIMLRPRYRRGEIDALMKTAHWDFLPLEAYKTWFATLPASVREGINAAFGEPEKSKWLADKEGKRGFVIPRMKLGNLVMMPQATRGEMNFDEDEKKIFHDTKVPLNHSYLASYLWIREQLKANAIIHFGTHGSQEWTPGKERGLWAFDNPNLLVGNVPVIYPYIVDNIGEAIHVKRRGRGVIVSYQTPAFAPAGLSDDFVKINDTIREYHALDDGPVKRSSRQSIIEQALKMNIDKDLKIATDDLNQNFETVLRDVEDYLEELGSAMQPLGLHTLGKDAERGHLINNVMQMLGQPFYEAMGIDAKETFRGDYKQLQQTKPYKFVDQWVFSDQPLADIADEKLRASAELGRKYLVDLQAIHEIEGVSKGLSARWIDPSYGGDPIRNPDAVPTGRNMYGFDPSRVPTPSAYESGKKSIEELIVDYKKNHDGQFPEKLTFTMWSTETMRHMGMLEAQIMYALGVKPIWDKGGKVTGMEVIPQKELGRPRIDTVISLTGLYRDQFPNVMERFNEAIVMVANLNESDQINFVRRNTLRIKAQLMGEGVADKQAEDFALTRVFGNESGDYGTKLPKATLASDKWEKDDGKLAKLYLSRMSWAYGPDTGNWSKKLKDGKGNELNAYAEHLKGTSAAVFSRSSNLRGLLDMDHPFEYLGGISLAVQHLDGKAPQLYISNMRDPNKTKLETAEKFMAKELRAVYHHPNWMKEMQKEGYSGTLKMLDVVNNFWGWQTMDKNIVRNDQWQEFHETYVKDRYNLKMREWFEKSNPTALAQITERMLEAIRKDYWQADEQTKKELVQVYQEIAAQHDVHTDNQAFKAYVAELAQGYGIGANAAPDVAQAAAQSAAQALPADAATVNVQGQQLQKQEEPKPVEEDWTQILYLLPVLLSLLAGMLFQFKQRQDEVLPKSRGLMPVS